MFRLVKNTLVFKPFWVTRALDLIQAFIDFSPNHGWGWNRERFQLLMKPTSEVGREIAIRGLGFHRRNRILVMGQYLRIWKNTNRQGNVTRKLCTGIVVVCFGFFQLGFSYSPGQPWTSSVIKYDPDLLILLLPLLPNYLDYRQAPPCQAWA